MKHILVGTNSMGEEIKVVFTLFEDDTKCNVKAYRAGKLVNEYNTSTKDAGDFRELLIKQGMKYIY